MKDISKQTIEDLIKFMYGGEVNVEQDDLQDFFMAANALQIKGLDDGFNKFHSQMYQSSSIKPHKRLQYQSTQTNHFTGSFTATEFNVTSTPAPTLNINSTKYENQDKNELDFKDEDFALTDGDSDGDFEYDNGTEEPVIDHKFTAFAEKWNNDIETGTGKARMDTGAPMAKRIKRNKGKWRLKSNLFFINHLDVLCFHAVKDLSDYNIVADIRLNGEGKENLFHESFKFGKHNKKDCPLTRWTCTKHSKNKCRAVMSTAVINGVRMMKVIRAEHTHQPE